jgi:hypothetical protein
MRWAPNSSVTFAPVGVVSSRILSHVPDPKVAHPEKRNKKREMVNAFKIVTSPLKLSSMAKSHSDTSMLIAILTKIGATTEQQQGGRADTKKPRRCYGSIGLRFNRLVTHRTLVQAAMDLKIMSRSRLGKAGATLYFSLRGRNPLPEVDLGQIKLADRLGPCFHSRYFLCDSPRGHQSYPTGRVRFF